MTTIKNRNTIAITGKVDFCIKMHKLHSNIEAIWDVYGILLKIIKGKLEREYILLLRSNSGGPVLQSIFYDFNNKINSFNIGCNVRAVGNFGNPNYFKIFKLEIVDLPKIDKSFPRIHSVTSFVIMQTNMKN